MHAGTAIVMSIHSELICSCNILCSLEFCLHNVSMCNVFYSDTDSSDSSDNSLKLEQCKYISVFASKLSLYYILIVCTLAQCLEL